ncbi:MAG: class I SAM-dependent methyltransferase [Planctomycetota bacterium]
MAARQRTKKKRGKRKATIAETADRYELYEGSVYMPEADHDFLVETYRDAHKRRPLRLREDFAGTSQLSALWVDKHPDAQAWAVDLDPEPMAWGKARHIDPLGEKAERLLQLEENVLDVQTPQVDVVTAFNFSYWVFEERKLMLEYFRKVLAVLDEGGMFAVDLMGGPGAQSECEEEREEDDGFTYIWEQEVMDAITHHMECHIHFEFEDGSRMQDAFTYSWRLWSLAELRDVMYDAGFTRVDTYWEGTDEDGEGDGVFTRRKHAENEETFVAYLVGWKDRK